MYRTVLLAIVGILMMMTLVEGQTSISFFIQGASTINQNSFYSFQLSLGSDIKPGTATITLDPTVFSFPNMAGISNCFSGVNQNILSCTTPTANTISFRWTTSMQVNNQKVSVSTIKNPPYVDNYTMTLDFASDNTSIVFPTTTGTMTAFSPDVLTSAAVTFSPNYTNTLSIVTFNMVNTNQIPAGGSLTLTFAGYTPTTSSTITINALNSTTFVNTAASSIYNSNTKTLFLGGFFSNIVPAGTSLTFSIGNILTPPTLPSSINEYKITILTSAKSSSFLNKIDQSDINITAIEGLPTASLSTTSQITPTVGDRAITILTDFLAPSTIDFATDTIQVVVDANSLTYLSLPYTSIIANINLTSIINFRITTITNGISFPLEATIFTIALGTPVRITYGILADLVVNSGNKTLSITFKRSGKIYSTNTFNFFVNPNLLTSATVSALSTTVSTSTTYTFTMTITSPLGIGAGVTITLPSTVSIATGACTAIPTISLVSAVTTTFTCNASTAQSITISNISNVILPSGTVITLQIANINNPTTTQTTTSFYYKTYYSLTEMVNAVDNSTGKTMTITPAPITIPAPNFIGSKVGQTNREFTDYTFVYKVFTTFPSKGYLTITMPSTMVLSSGATASFVLSTTGITNSTVPMTSNSTSTTLITLDFNGLITSILPSGTIFTITISTIQNHYSFKPVNAQLISFTNTGFSVQQSSTSALTFTNSIAQTTMVVGTSNTITVNGDTIAYNILVTPPVALTSTDLISVQLNTTGNPNTQLAFTTSVSCSVAGVGTNCTKNIGNSNLLTVTTGTAIMAGTPTILTLTSILLSRSKDQPGTILIKTYQSSSGAYLISSVTLTPPINTQTNLVTSASLTLNDNGISSPRLNQNIPFSLSFTPTNPLNSGDYIVITVPSTWTSTQSSLVTLDLANIATQVGSLCSTTSVFCSNHQSNSNKIRIDDKGSAFSGISNHSFTIAASTFASPKNFLTTYSTFTFQTYTSTNALIDASNATTSNLALFSLACPSTTQYHCKTCDSAGLCTACYQIGDGVDTTWNFGGFVVVQSTGECVSSCSGNYFNSSNICLQCTAPCFGCLDATITSCTSCIAPHVLNASQCLSSCPSGYFNSSSVCVICTSPCLTCSGTSTTCLSCNNNTFLNGNVCGSSCTGVTGTYADSVSWTCASCSIQCSQCSISASNCTTCVSTYFLTSPNTCTQSCPTGTAKLNSTTCTCNFTVCATCVLDINTCLSCQTGLVLLSSTCASSCGVGFYNSSNVCVACVSNCNTCDATGCSSCSTTFPILFNNACLSSCATGTTQSGSTCITCPTNCDVCSTSALCTTCISIYYLAIYTNGTTECTRPCPSVLPFVQNNQCVSACTAPLIVDTATNSCYSANATTSTTTVTTASLTSDTSKVIPFPVTIGLCVFAIATFASKVALPNTIVAASLAAFGGLAQIISWFIFVIAVSVDSTSDSLGQLGMFLVIVAYLITLILNVTSIIFFKKYIWSDDKFQNHFKKLQTRTTCGVSVTYLIFICSTSLSHKIVELLFSNVFQANYFIYKVTQVNKFTPINYVRYISILPTIVAIIGASLANYQVQAIKFGSFLFVQSIDLIVVTILAAIAGIWVTIRNEQQYENVIERRGGISEEYEQEGIEDDINQFEEEQKSGIKKKFVMISSLRNADKNDKNDPLKRKMVGSKNPIGEEYNITTNPLNNEEQDLQRVDIGGGRPKLTENGLDYQDIGFQDQSGTNLYPQKSKIIGKVGRKGKQSKLSDKQRSERQKLKDSIEKKLNSKERQQTRVIRDVDGISPLVLVGSEGQPILDSSDNIQDKSKNQQKKQKLNALSSVPEQNLQKLSDEQRQKADQIKAAMSLLEAKKISISDYLDYLDIIEQQNQDKNSDDYEENKLSNRFKNHKSTKNGQNKRNLARSLRKMQKKDKIARYNMDKNLMVSHIDDLDLGHGTYDEESQPQPPDFHGTPINRRMGSQDMSPTDLQELKLSGLRGNNKNRSQQVLKKNKNNLDDILLISNQSGDNDDPGMGAQFQKGNTLKQSERDQPPPSNMYSTEKMVQSNKGSISINSFPFNKDSFLKDRMGKNTLIGQDDNIEYLQSEGNDNLQGQLIQFNNDIAPSHFDEPNLRIESDVTSDAPTKPKMPNHGQSDKIVDNNDNDQVLQIEDIEDVDNYDEFGQSGMRRQGMNRYRSSDRNLDYDDIIEQQRRNKKMKQLQQIYLPRQQVTKMPKPKKRLNHSTNSYRLEQK